MTVKSEMRRRLRRERACLAGEVREATDAAIAGRVRLLDAWRSAGVVYAYLSFGAEVDTRTLIGEAWREGKAVALPRCVPGTRRMRWFVVDSLEGLQRSPLGVEEPVARASCEVSPEGDARSLALVPGLAFDLRGFRLGYGGGYYDGFLCGFLGASVGLCRYAFLMEDLGAHGLLEAHDAAVDVVVTERLAMP